MNIAYLTSFQLITFVLGIVFSILTIAVVFHTFRIRFDYKHTFVKVLFVLIIPMITYFMWFACIFAAFGIFNSSELYIILLSLGCAIVLSAITYFLAWAVERKTAPKTEEVKAEEKVDVKKVKVEVVYKDEAKKEDKKTK